jgi:hypothetical protein
MIGPELSPPASRRGVLLPNLAGLAALLIVLLAIAWPLGVACSLVWRLFVAGWSVTL